MLDETLRARKDMFDSQRKVMNSKDEDYGLTIPEGISFQTMTSGDRNDTAETMPHFDMIKETLKKKARDPLATLEDRLAAQTSLRLTYREIVELI